MSLIPAIHPTLQAYLLANNPPEHPASRELRELTATMPRSNMQVSPEQAHFLGLLVRLIGARRVLELGTFTGYSSLAMALALPADGRLVTCDVSEEWTGVARRFWKQAGVDERITLRLGAALESLQALRQENATFDFAFIDANKEDYDAYYEAVLPMVRPGGLIVLDNTLRDGDVADPDNRDRRIVAMRGLNAKLAADERVDRALLPLRDGVTLARKR
jgi:predicted O-methyltransferase YrrM